jgi:hypothetical protein
MRRRDLPAPPGDYHSDVADAWNARVTALCEDIVVQRDLLLGQIHAVYTMLSRLDALVNTGTSRLPGWPDETSGRGLCHAREWNQVLPMVARFPTVRATSNHYPFKPVNPSPVPALWFMEPYAPDMTPRMLKIGITDAGRGLVALEVSQAYAKEVSTPK